MNTPAPIVLFVYNRPEHTRRTLDALSRNPEAKQSVLYVYSDGPKRDATSQDMERIAAVRRVVREKEWCGSVHVQEAAENLGLAKSIITGVTEVVERHGKVIVLEDDIEVTHGFLAYMNAALDLYEEHEEVFQVSAFMVPARWLKAKTGMLRVSTSWGWATWSRAWRFYSDDAAMLLQRVRAKGAEAFDLGGFSFHLDELERNVTGELQTWAIRWYASIFLEDGLCLYPYRPLIKNLGFDGTGTHCNDDTSGAMSRAKVAEGVPVRAIACREDSRYLRAMQRHYRRVEKIWTQTTLKDRAYNKARRITNRVAGLLGSVPS